MSIGLNWVDLVLMLFLVGGLMIGFMRGLLWEFIGLASLYIGAVIASQYYYYLSDFLRRLGGPSVSLKLLTAVSFVFLLFLVSLIVSWAVIDAFQSTKLKLFPSLDHLGGTVVGTASVTALIIVLAPVFLFAIGEPWPTGWPEGIREFLTFETKHSFLLPLINELKPIMLETLKPWLPSGLPSVFNL